MRLFTQLLVLISLGVPLAAFAANEVGSQDFKWPPIRNLTAIGASSATLESNWKDGKMNFVLQLQGVPKENLYSNDIELKFLDEIEPAVDVHLYRIDFSSLNKQDQSCNSSIDVDLSSYNRLTRKGKWQIGIAKRSYSTSGSESDRYYGTATYFDPRHWYGDNAINPSIAKVRDVCHEPSSPSGAKQKGVWSQVPWMQGASEKEKTAASYCLGAKQFVDQRQYQKAIEEYGKALELDGNDAEVYLSRAQAYSKLGQGQKAIDDYTAAIRIHPKGIMYYVDRGEEYHKQRQYQKAIDDYNKAISLDPRKGIDGEIYGLRGDSYLELDQGRQAIDDYTVRIKFAPDFGRYYKLRGDAYHRLGQEKEAAADYGIANTKTPTNVPGLLVPGNIK